MTKKKSIREEAADKLLAHIVPFWAQELTQREGEILTEVLVEGKKFGELETAAHLTSFRQRQIFEHGVARLIKRISESRETITGFPELKRRLDEANKKLAAFESKAKQSDKSPKPKISKQLQRLLETHIKDTTLSTRVKTICEYGKIESVKDLLALSRIDFLRLRNSGRKSNDEVFEFFAKRDLTWPTRFDV